ncbi:MAG: oligosaccharide flippase family protein [Candidatus Methanomethyliaceae archaeon]
MSFSLLNTQGKTLRDGFAPKVSFQFLGQVMAFIANFTVGILIARLLGPEGKGGYALISANIWILYAIINLGLPGAVTFFIGRHRWPPVHTAFLASIFPLSGWVIVLLILASPGSEWLLRKTSFTPEVWQLTWLMVMTVLPLQLISPILSGVLRGRELIYETTGPRIIMSILRILFISVSLLALKKALSSVIYAEIVLHWVGIFWLLLIFHKALRKWPPALEKPQLGRLMAYSLQLYVGGILGFLWARLDLYFVNYFCQQTAVGLYSVAMVGAELASFPSDAISSVLFSRLSLSTPEERTNYFQKVFRSTLIINFFTVIGLLGGSFLIPFVYGRNFAPAIPAMMICLGGSLFRGGVHVLYTFFATENRQFINILATFAGLLTMIALDLVMIPFWGIHGAATAYGISIIVVFLCLLFTGFRWGLLTQQHSLLPRTQDIKELHMTLRAVIKVMTSKHNSR